MFVDEHRLMNTSEESKHSTVKKLTTIAIVAVKENSSARYAAWL